MNASSSSPMTASTDRGVIFYDADCRICAGGARRWRDTLARRGFTLLPLQTPGTAERLGVPAPRLLDEVRLLTSDGRVLGGADALLGVARHVHWAWPIYLLALLPGIRPLLRVAYRKLAPYRYCITGRCGEASPIQRMWHWLVAVLPLLIIPILAAALGAALPRWAFMWLMAGAILFGFKWLTWRLAPEHLRSSRLRSAAYLLAWPGMDAPRFLDAHVSPAAPRPRDFAVGMRNLIAGAALIWIGARVAAGHSMLLAGWVGMVGMILAVHFGAFELFAFLWRSLGIDAAPLMNRVLRAESLSDFWSRRWNRGFSDLARRLIVQPLGRHIPAATAVLIVFLLSGLLHELVITLPAGGGWGGPTAYFMIQGAAILLQRSTGGRALGIQRGIAARVFAALATVAPLPLLFPAVFVERVIVPFLTAIGAFAPLTVPLVLSDAIIFAGFLHFGILLASAVVPQVLDWRRELSRLSPLSRHVVWTHGAFIVLTIAGFGAISILCATELVSGTFLARVLSGFIATFWLIRLCLQFVLFDARQYLRTLPLRAGYHALTIVFLTLALTYTVAAVAPRGAG